MKITEILSNRKLPLVLILMGMLFISLGFLSARGPREPGTTVKQSKDFTPEGSLRNTSGVGRELGVGSGEGVPGKINLNQATSAELISLPGIGEVTSDKI